jgi:hypothetical protein
MDRGKCAEFDSPGNLLDDPNSFFCEMVHALGEVEATKLIKIAKGLTEET